MKQTKHSRKSEAQNNVQNVHHSREHMHSNDYAIAQSQPWWWCSPAASTPSADVLSTPSHHGSANGRPSLEGYPTCCSPSDSNLESRKTAFNVGSSGVTRGAGGSGGSCPHPLAENLYCTAYCYCTMLRFTGHAIVIEIEPLTLTVLLLQLQYWSKGSIYFGASWLFWFLRLINTFTYLLTYILIRSIVGKWNIWVMRCGSFTSGNTQTPNCWL